MSNKTHSWPDGHWHWPVTVSHFHGVRRGGLIYTGGQASLNSAGQVVNPDDLSAQTRNVYQHVETILTDLGATTDDLVKLVIYFVGDESDEKHMLDILADLLAGASSPVVSTICLPALCYPGMRIELEGVAIDPDYRTDNNPAFIRSETLPALNKRFSHVVCCNNLIFTGDISALKPDGTLADSGDLISQTRNMMNNLGCALSLASASFDQVLKLNVFYRGDGTAENWETPAAIRASYFSDPGPAATGIALSGFAQEGLMTKIAVTAHATAHATAQVSEKNAEKLSPDKSATELIEATEDNPVVRYSWPEGHWNWTTALPYKHGNRHGKIIHLGGQVALDKNARVLHPKDIVAQTHVALENIKKILTDLNATMDDVVKVTTFYQGTASAEALHQNLLVRSEAFQTPGPATSGIPVPYLVYEDMVIEIEVIAVSDE